MRKIYLLLLLILTLDIAVMEEPWMYLLFAAEVVTSIVLFVQARLMWNGLEVGFSNKVQVMDFWRRRALDIKLDRGGKKTTRRAAVKLRMGYWQEQKKHSRKIYCGVSRIGEMKFAAKIPYCGLIKFDLEQFWINDRLMVFFAGKKLSDSMLLFVVPGKDALKIEYADAERSEDGSPVEPREGSKASVKLDLTGIKEADQRVLGNFYVLLSALVLGLLKCVSVVRVSWYDEWEQRSCCMEATGLEECRQMLMALYRMGLPDTEKAPETASILEDDSDSPDFCLDLQLRWFRNEQLIYQFSALELDTEMMRKSFTI